MTILEMSARYNPERERSGEHSGSRYQVERLFWQAHLMGKRRARLRKITGREEQLLDLNETLQGKKLKASRYGGKQSVPFEQILGSEGRVRDFDAAFKPLTLHVMDRWVALARVWDQGKTLPPVELIQVGDVYYVRDGHNRISIARFHGQTEIDAEVTVWELEDESVRERLKTNGDKCC